MNQNITFTVEEVNNILNALGKIPAEHSMHLIMFIQNKAEAQLKQPEPQSEVQPATE